MRLDNIIKKPIITEKSVRLQAEHNRYVFMVDMKATKNKIKNEIEDMFEVEVLDVRTMIIPGKKRRKRGKSQFTRSSPWKKAVITVKEGQSIDIFTDLLGGKN